MVALPGLLGGAREPARELYLHYPILAIGTLKFILGLIVAVAGPVFWGLSFRSPVPHWTYLITAIAFAAAASILIYGSRSDRRAFYLGAHYLCTAAAFAFPILRTSTIQTGFLLTFVNTIAALQVEAFLPYFLWLFTQHFPRTASNEETKLVRLLLVVSLATGCILFTATFLYFLMPDFLANSLIAYVSRLNRQSEFWTLLFALLIPSPFLIWSKARRASPEERHRARLFLAALLLAGVPACTHLLLEEMVPAYMAFMNRPVPDFIEAILIYPIVICVPVITTYSVLFHRALDVRVVVRKTLQHALARQTLFIACIVPIAGAFLFIYQNREIKISELIIGARFLVLAAAGGTALLMFRLREPLLAMLDRKFFREQVNAERVLSQILETSRSCRSVHELAEVFTKNVDSALHPESIKLLILDAGTRQFVSPDPDVAALPAESSLLELISKSREPVDVKLNSDRFLRLSESDRLWVMERDALLLVPLLATDGTPLGLVSLSRKKSDLPFSNNDRSLLSAAAASVSLSLENHLLQTSPSFSEKRTPHAGKNHLPVLSAAMECPHCGVVYSAGIFSCDACTIELVPAMVPQYLYDKFRFDRRIGRGGMGIVYKAEDLLLERYVAVKTLPILSPERLKRLRREAKAMAALHHPNLALIFGAETWADVPLLVFEYLDGGTLADRIKLGRMDIPEVLSIGVSLADALCVIHASNILHRDIKPSNIGFRADRTPKLLDFGVARVITQDTDKSTATPLQIISEMEKNTSRDITLSQTSLTVDGNLVGTPLYLAPEVLRSGKADHTSDLWALSLSLYEAIAGKNPFDAPGIWETLDLISSARVADIRDFRENCPAHVAAFFKTTLAAEPSRRPATAEQMKIALQRLIDSLTAEEIA